MASQEVTPAERIRELSAINADIPAMLEAAGKAINAITNNPLTKSRNSDEMDVENGDNKVTIEQRKAAFAEHTKAYYTTLQAKKLILSLLPQSTLSPFPLTTRPVHWDHATAFSALSLYPLPNTLVLADAEAEPFAMTFEGCHDI